jgi:hypothetical protein
MPHESVGISLVRFSGFSGRSNYCLLLSLNVLARRLTPIFGAWCGKFCHIYQQRKPAEGCFGVHFSGVKIIEEPSPRTTGAANEARHGRFCAFFGQSHALLLSHSFPSDYWIKGRLRPVASAPEANSV